MSPKPETRTLSHPKPQAESFEVSHDRLVLSVLGLVPLGVQPQHASAAFFVVRQVLLFVVSGLGSFLRKNE